MGRPKELTKTGSSYSRVKDVLYGAADEVAQIKVWDSGSNYWTETRRYNNLLQLTRLTMPGAIDLEYRLTPRGRTTDGFTGARTGSPGTGRSVHAQTMLGTE